MADPTVNKRGLMSGMDLRTGQRLRYEQRAIHVVARLCDLLIDHDASLAGNQFLFPSNRKLARLDDEVNLLGVVSGLALIGRLFFFIGEDSQIQILVRLQQKLVGRSFRSPEDARDIVSTLYECIVAARLAIAGMNPVFLPEQKTSGRKVPDILVPSHSALVECKHLTTKSHLKPDKTSFFATVNDRVEDAKRKFRNYDPSSAYCHVVCLDFPQVYRGIVNSIGLEHYVKLLNQVSTIEKPLQFKTILFTEMRLFESDSILKPDSMPHEIWHPDQLMGVLHDSKFALFLLDLFESLDENPLPFGAMPILAIQRLMHALPVDQRSKLRPQRWLRRWERTRNRMKIDLDPLALPPLAMFPTKGRDGEWTQIMEI